ncbi:GAF domain-containing protein [Cryptosporangium phraense]|uniref:GAF domain-containing protein n=1 Tax=Cryptosporangium phraense TaxID=2593070 RepID=A0A545AFV8_9ACTN|nr:GAF domain-containing protein [Cryptosporangium phraense]TQS40224.1 GAF domain-containing protein [Cryptosporangium phraense]
MKQLTEADRDALAAFDRLQAVANYDLTDPALIAELDVIAARTAEKLGQPVALTNLMLDSAAMVRGSYGVSQYGDAVNVPIEWSFCVRTVQTGELKVIPDLTLDPEEHDNPFVVHQGVRSYAGAPLSTPDGQVIGTHCVFGMRPREFSEAELATLTEAAGQIVTTLERYRRN